MRKAKILFPRLFVLGLLVVLSGAAIAWLLFKSNGFTTVSNDSSFQIALVEPVATSASAPIFQINGCATMPGSMQLLVNGVVYDSTNTSSDKTFRFENVALPSDYTIVVMATANHDGRTFSTNQVIEGSLKKDAEAPRATLTPSANVPCVLPLPAVAVAPTYDSDKALVTRRVTGLVSYKSLDVSILVELPKDDPRAVSLTTRRLSLPEFIRRVFLDFTIDGLPIDYKFHEVTPEIDTLSSSISVRATSSPKYRSFAPDKDGYITFSAPTRPENKNDAITLKVVDYTVQSLEPAPNATTADSVTWSGAQNEYLIKAKVDYDAFASPSKLAKVFRLSPYDLVPFQFSYVVATLLGLLAGVPILWFAFIISQHPDQAGLGESFVRKLQTSSLLLLTIMFTAPAVYSIYNLAGWVNTRLKARSPAFKDDDYRLLLITALLGFFLFLLLDLASGLVRQQRFRFFMQWFWRALRNAWALVVLFLIIIGFALRVVPPDRVNGPPLVAAAIAWVILLVLSGSTLRLYRTTGGEDGPWLSRSKAALTLVAFLLIAAALVDPGPPGDFVTIIAKRYTPILIYVRTFLFLLRDLMPYALIPGITIILWRIEKGRPEGEQLSWQLAKLLFVAFLVGSTANLFLIPIPFFLALWLFPRYVIEPPDKSRNIDAVRHDLFLNREQKLKVVLGPSENKKLADSLDQLDRNLWAGEVTSEKYDELKATIKDLQAKAQEDSTLPNDLPVKDLVIGIGLYRTNWENGKWAAARGLLLALPFAGLYLWELLQRSTWPRPPYFSLGLIISLVTFLAFWTVCAFFFGYFFPYLRGNSGLRKGLIVSGSIILCLLIVWVLSLTSPYALLLRVGQTVLFFTLLGLWSDYRSFRDAIGAHFNFKEFAQFEYIPSLAAFGSIALASLSTVINSIMQDHYQLVIKQLVGMVSQQFPSVPPH